MPDGKIGRRLRPAGFIRPGQTGKLPIVRREHDGRAGALEHRRVLRDGKERVGIEHERCAGLHNDRLHQRRERVIPAEARPEHAHIALSSRSSSTGRASRASFPSADGSGNGIASSFFTAVTA